MLAMVVVPTIKMIAAKIARFIVAPVFEINRRLL
jgi:hypothetical protein